MFLRPRLTAWCRPRYIFTYVVENVTSIIQTLLIQSLKKIAIDNVMQ